MKMYFLKEATMKKAYKLILGVILFTELISAQSFTVKGTHFLVNGKPFQTISGEMPFQRIPWQYWNDRLQKAKAMGLNTIATYVFWNAVEPKPGEWNFTGNNNLRKFLLLAKKNGLFVLLRPGPYVCGEWDFGGLPPWLLSIPDIRIRCMDTRYMSAVTEYVKKIADQVKDLQNTKGGTIVMLQIENEYGSYGNDKEYLDTLKSLWVKNGIDVPFYTADGAATFALEAGTVKGTVIGLDPATNEEAFEVAQKFEPGVPVFCSEYYPGWLTHWGEKWGTVSTSTVIKDLKWFMDNKKSFNIYVFHGGTNFGWDAGANMSNKYEPTITSYDYDAPLDEMGQPTQKYFAIRKLLLQYLPAGIKLPNLPKPLPVINIPKITITKTASIFNNLPKPIESVLPEPMEYLHQYHGLILYRTKLVGPHSGKLVITDLHDFANVYVDGKYIGSLDRAKGQNSIDIPKTEKPAQELEILVEAMGRINYGQHMIDRKGITKRVTLNRISLMNWQVYRLPMDSTFMSAIKFENQEKVSEPGAFFKGKFELDKLGDTYIDMSNWKMGIVWVNGHNLGRYWDIGPQQRLFLPAPFLKKGENKIIVFDMYKTQPSEISGVPELK